MAVYFLSLMIAINVKSINKVNLKIKENYCLISNNFEKIKKVYNCIILYCIF